MKNYCEGKLEQTLGLCSLEETTQRQNSSDITQVEKRLSINRLSIAANTRCSGNPYAFF